MSNPTRIVQAMKDAANLQATLERLSNERIAGLQVDKTALRMLERIIMDCATHPALAEEGF